MTDPRLVAGAGHLGYEVWQMTLAATELDGLGHGQQPGAADQKDAIVYNALLESMLLHSRELIDILLDTNRRGDDIRLSDFGSQWQISEQDQTSLAATKVLLNKHLVHLTWERVDAPPILGRTTRRSPNWCRCFRTLLTTSAPGCSMAVTRLSSAHWPFISAWPSRR